MNGVILLPDDWNSSYYSLRNTNTYDASYSSNTISASQWNILEQHGAVFLPAAGRRNGTNVNDVSSRGGYWSATHNYDSNDANQGVYFIDSSLSTGAENNRNIGQSVRLVCYYSFGINATLSPVVGGTISGGRSMKATRT